MHQYIELINRLILKIISNIIMGILIKRFPLFFIYIYIVFYNNL